MASDQEFVDYVCEQLRGVPRLSHRKMFGEYAIYVGEKVVALVCDNQLFVKPTAAGRALLGTPKEAPPYPVAKPFFLVEGELDDPELMSRLIEATEAELPAPKAKKAKAAKRSETSKGAKTAAPKKPAKAKKSAAKK
jgi:TfoX/Sxy family transcriptional regulator of competence genes